MKARVFLGDLVRNSKTNIAILSFPWASNAPYLFLNDLIEILKPLTNRLWVISSNKSRIKYISEIIFLDVIFGVHYVKDKDRIFLSYVLWILKFIIIEIMTFIRVLSTLKSVDTYLYISYPFNLPSLLLAKVFKKNIIILALGSPSQNIINHENILIKKLSIILLLCEKIFFIFADKIVIESPSLINSLNLKQYHQKVSNEGSRFLNLDIFKVVKKYDNRENLVGYIGRLDNGKGVNNLLSAIKIVINTNNDIKFLIIGSGPLYENIYTDIIKYKLQNKIQIIKWIPHSDVPKYLNKLKLFVLPSESEGLPTAVLESMACGTPVLATSVGGIPDIVKNNETGFILMNNSPEVIADNIIKVLDSKNLNKVSSDSAKLIKDKFDYSEAVERWEKNIISD